MPPTRTASEWDFRSGWVGDSVAGCRRVTESCRCLRVAWKSGVPRADEWDFRSGSSGHLLPTRAAADSRVPERRFRLAQVHGTIWGVSSVRDDVTALFDYVFGRFASRMEGLTDDEWAWCPSSDDRVTIRWRLAHIAGMLSEERNWSWLGVEPSRRPAVARRAESAAGALAVTAEAFAAWRGVLAAVSDADLAMPIGVVGGHYGDSTRRSLVLHIADELVHHSAEVALLRDLYAARDH